MSRAAKPMQCVLVVHAVTIARFGPVKPYLIETWPEIMLMIVPGTKNGEILSRAAFQPLAVVGLDGADAADAGAHRYAIAVCVRFFHFKAGILHRLHRCRDAVVHERIGLTRLFRLEVLAERRSYGWCRRSAW